MNLHLHNQTAWDARARRRQRHTHTATTSDLQDPLPKLDPNGWLGSSVAGCSLLCLASGGGLQSALAAAAGAKVTVVDLSAEMLALDQEMARRHGFSIRTLQTSMDDLHSLPPASFDIVIQPVSTCYIPNLRTVYDQVARILVPNGIYISQHKQPASLQAETVPSTNGYALILPYRQSAPLPPVPFDCLHRECDTLEFLHTWQALLGDLCQAGFVLEAFAEPNHADPAARPGTFNHRSSFLPPYFRCKARKINTPAASPLWTP